ncbi:MAG: hypothetical protein QNJ23_09695 [Woeseiaceae bacterium]|nr:hypothetical protein [Woeseiaceae bacterium]
MTIRVLHGLLWLILLVAVTPVLADEAEDRAKVEARKQEAFRIGFTLLIDDLNNQYTGSFVNSIDQEDMLDRIYGLRLVDQRIKRQFEENLENSFGPMIVSGAGIARAGIVPVFKVPESGPRYTILAMESRGDLGRAVVRVDLDDYQFNYQVFDLRLDSRERVVVVDWTDYLAGVTFSESVGRYLVLATPSQAALRKMLDIRNVTDRELYLFGEMLKAARDGNLDKFTEVRDSMHPRFQRQRIVVESGVHAAKARKSRRAMVAALGVVAEHYPEEPLYSLMLLDYLFPSRKYEEGIAALQRLAGALGVPDAAMDARMSAAFLAAGNTTEAVIHADAATEREPELELGWLSALNARNAAADFAGAVLAIAELESRFGYDLGPETLEKSKNFSGLIASSEYQGWLAER